MGRPRQEGGWQEDAGETRLAPEARQQTMRPAWRARVCCWFLHLSQVYEPRWRRCNRYSVGETEPLPMHTHGFESTTLARRAGAGLRIRCKKVPFSWALGKARRRAASENRY